MSGILKPAPESIRRLAIAEATPRGATHFAPICRGPLLAVVILVAVGALGLVAGLVAACGRLVCPSPRRHTHD